MTHDGLQVAQDRETPVQAKRHAAFSWRYAYARSADTRKVGDPGQDYLTFRYNDQAFTFVLCDGVSQSFFGDLAARFLGDNLMGWLWDNLPPSEDELGIRTAFAANLRTLAAQSEDLVKNHPLPEGIPQMLREVLEQKRVIGSETTFACGRVDLPGDDYPQGRVILAWMGDSRLRLWGPNGERTAELGKTFITEQRWSTYHGPVKGEPNLLVAPILNGGQHQIVQLMAYSDGLSSVDQYKQSPSNKELNGLISSSAETAVSDDISFLELWLDHNHASNKANNDVAIETSKVEGQMPEVKEAVPTMQTPPAEIKAQPQAQTAPVPTEGSMRKAEGSTQEQLASAPKRNSRILLIAALAIIVLAAAIIALTFIKF